MRLFEREMERKKPVFFLLFLLLSSTLCNGVTDKAEVEAFQEKKTSQSPTPGQFLNGSENLNREHFFSPTTESETMSDRYGDYSIQEFHPSRMRWNQHAVQLEYKPDGGRRRRRKRQINAAEDTVKRDEDDSSAKLFSGNNLIIIAACGVFLLVVLAAGLAYCFRTRCKRCCSRKDPEVGIPQEESLTNLVPNSSAGMPIVKVTIPSKHSTAKSCIIEIPEPIPLNLPLTPIPMRQSSSSTSFLNAELKPCGQSSLAESDNEMPRPAVQENHSGSTESLSSLQFLFEPALPLITQDSRQKNSKSLEAGATEDLTSNNQCKTEAIKKKRGKSRPVARTASEKSPVASQHSQKTAHSSTTRRIAMAKPVNERRTKRKMRRRRSKVGWPTQPYPMAVLISPHRDFIKDRLAKLKQQKK